MGTTKLKSPRFPHFRLARSQSHASLLFEACRHEPFTREDAYMLWGLPRGTAKGRRQLSTLLEYGFARQVGGRGSNTYRISRLYVLSVDANPGVHWDARERCALRPSAFRALWKRFASAVIAAEYNPLGREMLAERVKHYLRAKHEPPFSERGARLVWPIFRDTMADAGMLERTSHRSKAKVLRKEKTMKNDAKQDAEVRLSFNRGGTVTLTARVELPTSQSVREDLWKVCMKLHSLIEAHERTKPK